MVELITSAEAAKKLRVTTRTLQNWRDEGRIGFIKLNSKILFTQKHLDEFLSVNECTPFANEKGSYKKAELL